MAISFCSVIRSLVIVVASLGVLFILAPELFISVWPYFASVGVLVVPVMVYRWWDQRYSLRCSVNFRQQPDPGKDSRA